jgi:hypothetical protein
LWGCGGGDNGGRGTLVTLSIVEGSEGGWQRVWARGGGAAGEMSHGGRGGRGQWAGLKEDTSGGR